MTTTTNKGLSEPAYNDPNWNVPLNANFTILDNMAGSFTTLTTLTGSHTLSLSEYQPGILKVTGTLSGDVIYVIPSGVGGQWTVTNLTTMGAHSLTFASAGAGSSVSIPASVSLVLYSDGTNIVASNTVSAPSSSIANAQLVQVAANTIKGNPTSGTANVQDASVTTYLDLIGSTQGNLMYRNASSWTVLAPGTAGQALITNGAAANPSWGSVLASQTGNSGKFLTTNGTTTSWTDRGVSAFASVGPHGAADPYFSLGRNITSVGRNIAGQWIVYLAFTATTTFYAVSVGASVGATGVLTPVVYNQTGTSFYINWVNTAGALEDPVDNATNFIGITVVGGT